MTEEIQSIVKSRTFKTIIYGIAALLILLFVFEAGVFVGFEKASFYNKIGENYLREINGGGNTAMAQFNKSDAESAHGAIGKIIELKLPEIVIEDHDGTEKTVSVASTTQIKNANTDETSVDLHLDDYVVVFGSPSANDPVLLARLIRVLPTPTQ